MGCVLPGGRPGAGAAGGARRRAPQSVPCTTVNKMCGSGMKTVMMASETLTRAHGILVAGGMESMRMRPTCCRRSRRRAARPRRGQGPYVPRRLEDAYDKGRLIGTFAEDTAQHYQFSREAQDAFAIESLRPAKAANEGGAFAREIVAVDGEGAPGRARSPATSSRSRPTRPRSPSSSRRSARAAR